MTQSPSVASTPPGAVRHRSFAALKQHAPLVIDGNHHWRMRGQNFLVELVDAGVNAFTVDSQAEVFLIFPNVAGTVSDSATGEALARAGVGSVCVVAPGRVSVQLAGEGSCAVIATQRNDIDDNSDINADAYWVPDPRIKPTGQPYTRLDTTRVQVFDMAAVPAPADSPRLKMLQTATLSINWVQYHGVRDRTALSPHSHADFEQGSLALAGDFVHHLRVDWGKNADLWRDDEHLPAPSPSLAVVPVHMIHTTEGVGDGHHLLIDIFSPPRTDFIARGWVHNAGDYRAADAA